MQIAHPAPSVSRAGAFSALRTLLRPAVRLALGAGLKFGDLDGLLRELLAEVGQAELARRAPTGRVNLSALSVLTGLHRKELARLCDPDQSLAAQGDALPSDSRSAASQVLLNWAREAEQDGALLCLSLADFTERARRWVTDVHPRAVLDELLRLGLVRQHEEAGGPLELLSPQFVPSTPGDDRLLLMAGNVRAHLEAGVRNSLPAHPGAPTTLEQSLGGEGMALADCQAVAQLARGQWQAVHRQMFDAISKAPACVATAGQPADAPHRIQIGMFVLVEPMDPQGVES